MPKIGLGQVALHCGAVQANSLTLERLLSRSDTVVVGVGVLEHTLAIAGVGAPLELNGVGGEGGDEGDKDVLEHCF